MPKFAWLASHEAYQPETLIEQTLLAEKVGFDMVTASDHFHPWVDDNSAAGFVWTWLGAAAAQTERLMFATSVTCPLFHYHPALIAQAAATVDRLSDGRFILGRRDRARTSTKDPSDSSSPVTARGSDGWGRPSRSCTGCWQGEKLDFEGTYYQCRKAKLYSPPTHEVPIWMAAGGEKSAAFAGKNVEGLIVSVKDPEEAVEKIIKPFQGVRQAPGTVMATRWVVLAATDAEAWEALGSMRGLRAPGRAEEVDPMVLRQRADEMDREEILSKYTVVKDAAGLIDAYRPLVTDVGAEYVSIQVASTDPDRTLNMIGSEVLPELRKL